MISKQYGQFIDISKYPNHAAAHMDLMCLLGFSIKKLLEKNKGKKLIINRIEIDFNIYENYLGYKLTVEK